MGNVIKEWVKDGCGKYKGVFIAYKKTPTFFVLSLLIFLLVFLSAMLRILSVKKQHLSKHLKEQVIFPTQKNVNKIYHKIPPDYRIDFYFFLKRCIKYFKDANYTPYWILGLMLKIEKRI